ncbi:MAG: Xaa-Pro peptidase family protein [Deltaproteobacteria bacterium]|jgi:Xaa-Pro aminopeptidase|nr:Xaa-Pro peptidase family protein [Deltaproteobacteria bacterium]
MFTSIEVIPLEELALRRRKCLELLRQLHPEAGGILIFSRLNIYYFTGTLAVGLLWIPHEGEPVLAVRKGLERARLESPHSVSASYKSYSRIAGLLEERGSPLTRTFALEQNGLTWSLGLNFSRYFQDFKYVAADDVLERTRGVKTDWELAKLRLAGQRHYTALCKIFPERVRPDMNAYQISRLLWDIFFELGHSGPIRMAAPGEESFLGSVCVGENSAYPSYYNGPLGLKGAHPSSPYMGYAGEVWSRGTFLGTDVGFVLEGYNSDKTAFYFAGKPSEIPAQARKAQDCCLEIQAEIASRLKPGAIPQELYRHALDMAAKRGFGLNFMGHGGNQVPFIGHGLGLNLDEWPALADKFTEPLRENMVIALEPKITIPGYGMLGVESTLALTATGCVCLNNASGDLRDDPGDIICCA